MHFGMKSNRNHILKQTINDHDCVHRLKFLAEKFLIARQNLKNIFEKI
jgi:hypothetical protein